MRLLWFSNETPDLHGQGGQRRQYFQIQAFVDAGHSVSLMTLTGDQDATSVDRLAVTPTTRVELTRRFGRPHRRGIAALRDAVTSPDWDAVVVAHLDSWQTLAHHDALPRARSLLDVQNVLSRWYRLQGLAGEAARWAERERRMAGQASALSVCSERERVALLASTGINPIVAANGIDVAEWPLEPAPAARPVIKLFGNWDWDPNRAGLAWFLGEIWPRVSATHDVVCEVAGSGVDGPLPGGVRFVGRVPVMADFLHDAWAVAVPVLDGVGAPVKYAEALVTGVPLATTLDAADGDTPPGALVSDDADAWVTWLGEVLARPADLRVAATRRRRVALDTLTWARASAPLVAWVAQASGGGPAQGR